MTHLASMIRRLLLPFLCFVLVPSVYSQDSPGLRGYSAASASAQRDVERRFQAVPKPENLREYMRAITETPHHAGSPGSRPVAPFPLGKLAGPRKWPH